MNALTSTSIANIILVIEEHLNNVEQFLNKIR